MSEISIGKLFLATLVAPFLSLGIIFLYGYTNQKIKGGQSHVLIIFLYGFCLMIAAATAVALMYRLVGTVPLVTFFLFYIGMLFYAGWKLFDYGERLYMEKKNHKN